MALTLISTATISSAVSSVEFTSGIDGTYLVYELHLIGITPTSNGTELALRISTDGGSTWKSGASDYEFVSVSSGYIGLTGASYIWLSNTAGELRVGNTAGYNYVGVITVFDPSNTSVRTQCIAERSSNINAGYTNKEVIGGSYKSTTAVDGLQILVISGTTMETGELKLYGVAAS